jgi:hypothetical protein
LAPIVVFGRAMVCRAVRVLLKMDFYSVGVSGENSQDDLSSCLIQLDPPPMDTSSSPHQQAEHGKPSSRSPC